MTNTEGDEHEDERNVHLCVHPLPLLKPPQVNTAVMFLLMLLTYVLIIISFICLLYFLSSSFSFKSLRNGFIRFKNLQKIHKTFPVVGKRRRKEFPKSGKIEAKSISFINRKYLTTVFHCYNWRIVYKLFSRNNVDS